MKSSVATSMLRSAATKSMARLLNQYGVFTGGDPAMGLQKGWEIITQPIRDYQDYPATGFRSLAFFQQQAGSAGTTPENQNMPGAGQFPRGQMFLLEGLEVDFKPAGNPFSVSVADAAVPDITNDLWRVTRSGYLTMSISTRPYLNVGPLSQFPPSFRVNGAFALADTTTAAADRVSAVQVPYDQGENFQMIPYLLEETVNFVVTLNYDTPVTVATAGLIGVNMNGSLIRRNQ